MVGKPKDRFILTVPKEVVRIPRIKGKEKVRVLIDTKARRIICELLEEWLLERWIDPSKLRRLAIAQSTVLPRRR